MRLRMLRMEEIIFFFFFKEILSWMVNDVVVHPSARISYSLLKWWATRCSIINRQITFEKNGSAGIDDSPKTGVSSSNSTRTRPLRNWPGKKRSDEFSKRIRNLSNLRPPCGAMEPTSLKRDISGSLLAPPCPKRRNVYKLLDDAVFSPLETFFLWRGKIKTI